MNPEKYDSSKFPTGTLVFGLILVVVALAQLTRHVFSWSFDAPLFFITLIALAGIALIISGVASARRAASRKNTPPPYDSNQL
ncbi:hypothetical protein OK351_01215 [Glutamicibacter sp. MNS18]|uniref:hypothetical protein n=1 Tax=Glutamicibacter sp. MNS18 TaxID=2989817 RepID=UPI002235D783|nr:hypothetical protein [Glutamicibacter sp. MNS18]MCW4464133.1 hypothetical protein [Glutamicibacter sp. MNS18]